VPSDVGVQEGPGLIDGGPAVLSRRLPLGVFSTVWM